MNYLTNLELTDIDKYALKPTLVLAKAGPDVIGHRHWIYERHRISLIAVSMKLFEIIMNICKFLIS